MNNNTFVPPFTLETVTVFHNARIWSGKTFYDWLETNENGIIVNAGNGAPPENKQKVDLKGAFVIPGLHDSHIHVYSLGRTAFRLNLQGIKSLDELKVKLKQYADAHPEHQWIVGFGWDQDQFDDPIYPSKHDLDSVVPDRPVVLFRACHHIAVLNSLALSTIGIDLDTPNPPGGLIDRQDGVPTGILREDALRIITPYIEKMPDDIRELIFKKGLEICSAFGLTSVHTNDPKAWKIYKKIAENNDLPIRVFLTIPFRELDQEDSPNANEEIGLLKAKRVKLFADGSLGASTAALNDPYSDRSAKDAEGKGILIHSSEELIEMVKKIHMSGFIVETHAIGDRAAEQVLSAYNKLGLERQVLTHCQVLSPKAIELMKKSKTIANIQPAFILTDSYWANARVGDRIRWSYAWKTLLDQEIVCAGGSDSPIETANPLVGIHCAVFRKTNAFPNGWNNDERLSILEAISIYTFGGAFAVGEENKLGLLEPGYYADLTVLDTDIISNPDKLLNANVISTFIAGKEKYRLNS